MLPLLEQTPAELRDWFVEQGLPGYRAGQVWKWLFQQAGRRLRPNDRLARGTSPTTGRQFQIWTTQVVEHRTAADGTEKLLLELHDAERIECVLLARRQTALRRLHQHASRLRDGLRRSAPRASTASSAI